jgi:hypothetical protein
MDVEKDIQMKINKKDVVIIIVGITVIISAIVYCKVMM